jgi:hypothetical protein
MRLRSRARGTFLGVPEPWSPPLHQRESNGRCRLWLANYLCGDGITLQEAGDDLVGRLRTIALQARDGAGPRWTRAVGPVDLRWFAFLHELGELAADGADIRPRVFGSAP